MTDVTQSNAKDDDVTSVIRFDTEVDGNVKNITTDGHELELTASCDITSIPLDQLRSDDTRSPSAQLHQHTPRRHLSSSGESPSGLRRALLLTLDGDSDVIVHEPTKRYRCDVTNCDAVALTSSAALHVTFCDGSAVQPSPHRPSCAARVSAT
jgi:hypothetical protein